ncbi:MAG: SusC/RagA family TonB-linked outer membrane protein, partial [Bacteroidaceae bacterium]|nr:SusC/RagA family TonB-linked outer membrane protein [Bacteroidaceae bacterium]
ATKASFTGSASVVDNKTIEQVQSSNALDALAGHVAGVEIVTLSGDPTSQTPVIRMRGISSINGGTSPLIVLDGTPFDGDMNTIASTDIESMTVLKDAAASALYGVRGANGVIMITTKRAKAGSGALVKFDAKWGANSRARRSYKTISDPAKHYETHYAALNNYFMNAYLAQGAPEELARQYASANANGMLIDDPQFGLAYNVYTLPDGEQLIGLDGKLNPNARMGAYVADPRTGENMYYMTPDDWMDEIYHNGLRQEYNLSVSNATDKSNFMASVNYLDNQGIVDNSSYTRLAGRLKADLQAKPWLKVGANLGYTHYTGEGMTDDGSASSYGNLFAIASQVAPIYPLYMRDANGRIMKDANGYTMYDYGGPFGSYYGFYRPVYQGGNAVADNLINENSVEGNSMSAMGFAEIKFAKDFKFTSTNSAYVDEYRRTGYTNPYYGQYADSDGMVDISHGRDFTYDFRQQLEWGHIYGKHDVHAMVGHDYYRRNTFSLSGSRHGMFDPENNRELGGAVNLDDVGSSQTAYNTEGYFGRAQYNYDSKYFLSASYSRGASSRFHPDHRWGNFYSASAAWVISQEKFMKKAKWVDFLKLKVSYGEQGNDQIGNYRYVNTYSINNNNGKPAVVPGVMGNKDITWEKNGNLNAGLEFELFKGRLSGGVEYFRRKTRDMLFSFALPPSMGFTARYDNIGDMLNQGLELELNGVAVKAKNVQWTIGANLSFFKNKITSLPDEKKTLVLPDGTAGFANGNFFIGEGKSLYTYYMREYAGVYNESTYQSTGLPYDASLDGHPLYYKDAPDGGRMTTLSWDAADRYLQKDAMVPKLTGGFNTRLDFFGFDFSADFTYSLGGKVYDTDYAGMMGSLDGYNSGNVFHEDILNAWSATNPGSDIPRLTVDLGSEYTNSTSTRFLTSANYLSLQNITFGYTLPAKLTKKAHIDKLRFYVNASNVWLWTARRGLDPRTALLTDSSYGEGNSNYYSPMRTISGGVSITF